MGGKGGGGDGGGGGGMMMSGGAQPNGVGSGFMGGDPSKKEDYSWQTGFIDSWKDQDPERWAASYGPGGTYHDMYVQMGGKLADPAAPAPATEMKIDDSGMQLTPDPEPVTPNPDPVVEDPTTLGDPIGIGGPLSAAVRSPSLWMNQIKRKPGAMTFTQT